MKKIIYIADLHLKENEPYASAGINLLEYLLKEYNDCIIIQGGDLFDSSRHSHDFVYKVSKILLQFNDLRLLTGNHDQSYALGSILKSLKLHKNITVYDKIEKINIEGIDFQIIPFQYGKFKETCEAITEDCDYSLSHLMPIQEAFNNEGIDLKFKANVAHIFAHVHRYKKFSDNHGNKCLIAGISMVSRNGEEEWQNNVYELTKEKYVKIPLPKFMDIKTITYGEEISAKNIVYNIQNAPDINSVYLMYPHDCIRRDGITLSKNEEEGYENFKLSGDFRDHWNEFCKEEGVDKDYFALGIKKIENLGGES